MPKKEQECSKLDGTLRHIAFIMDGNGRWATKRLLPREAGHRYGAASFLKIIKYCAKIGLQFVTVYAFSTENWKRPQKEVDSIMALLSDYLVKYEKDLLDNQLRIRFIGDLTPFSDDLKKQIEKLEALTVRHERILNVALNYGGRDEILHACNTLMAAGKTSVTPEDFSGALYTEGCPDPDLIIRTAGEQRLSNFLLWQAAYSEFYFTDVLWPDFSEKDVDRAIAAFYSRKRRFGGV